MFATCPHPCLPDRWVHTCSELPVGIVADTPDISGRRVFLIGDTLPDGGVVNLRLVGGVWSMGVVTEERIRVRFIDWPKIQQFHNIVETIRKHDVRSTVTITYRPKIKLHGTNASIQILPGNTIVPQSRNTILSLAKDNVGFARWVDETKEAWSRVRPGMIVHGEWCGKGIQKGDAICMVEPHQFCVFAIEHPRLNPTGEFDPCWPSMLITDPDVITSQLDKLALPNVHVLPWYAEPITVVFGDESNIQTTVDDINAKIEVVGKEDPWVRATFGVQGSGEGLVYMPIAVEGAPSSLRAEFARYVFKAKTDEHAVNKYAKRQPAEAKPVNVGSIEAFVTMAVSERRCEQGVAIAGDRENNANFPTFLKWLHDDVRSETGDELAALGLEYKHVQAEISKAARGWWFS